VRCDASVKTRFAILALRFIAKQEQLSMVCDED
jgi:hypothetical protein